MKLRFLFSKDEAAGVKTFLFHPETPITWKPGQYMHYRLPHNNVDDRGDERYFTISSAPYQGGYVTITTRLAGDTGSSFKRALNTLQPNTEIEADGPHGDFVMDDPSQRYIFIAGGIGITPFHAMLGQLDHDGQPLNVDLLYANRDDDYVFDGFLGALVARHPEFKIHKFTGERRIDEHDILALVDDITQPQFYLSGPEPMVKNYAERLKTLKVPDEHVHLDDFPGYAHY